MKTYPLAFALALAVLALSASPRVSAAPPLFRPPQTAAEKAMDEILRTSLAHPELFFIVLQNPAYDLSKTKEYEPLFTAEFLTAWRGYERELVAAHCAGEYIPGKHCGYEYPNPITCRLSNPIGGPYIYRTLMGDDIDAYVSALQATGEGFVRTYHLRYDRARWKLAGFYCESTDPDFLPKSDQVSIMKLRAPRLESEKKLEEILRLSRNDPDSTPFIFDLSWRDRAQDRRFLGLFTPAFLRSAKEKAGAFLKDWCPGEYVESGKWRCFFRKGPIACELSETELWIERTTMEKDNKAVIVYSDPDQAYSYSPRERPPTEYRMRKDDEGWKLDGFRCGRFGEASTVNIP